MKSVHDVIIRPVLTEKAYDGFADKKYVFEVAINATKTEIKQAVEAVFAEDGVKVERSIPCARSARSSVRAAVKAAPRKSRKPMLR